MFVENCASGREGVHSIAVRVCIWKVLDMRLTRESRFKKTELAEVLGVSRNTISSWLKTGRLKDATLDAVLEFVREDERRVVCEELMQDVRLRMNGRRRDDEEEVR